MCGIGGIITSRQDLEHGGRMHVLAACLAHRGPDDEGIEIVDIRGAESRVLALVHRRLSIIDLSPAGHQPMRDPESSNWIVFNGEIYNFKDLRDELERGGHVFHTNSDTEVILRAYRAWGVSCLERLRGMFAFAIWDDEARKLLLAVDRLGIKPLYYACAPGGEFVFASEVRALLETGLVPRCLDADALESYLAFGAVQAPLTMVRGVRSLLPGHYLEVDATGRVEAERSYWAPPLAAADTALNGRADALVEGLRAELEEAVHYHLVSDVPVGIFLSGGIDSSSLVALVARVASHPPLTFSVVFPETEFSEAPYSRLVAQAHRTRHTEVRLSERDLLDVLPAALGAMDQPTIDGVNVYVVSQAVRRAGLKVVLSGQGGDETLTGYPTYRQMQGFARYHRVLAAVPLPLRRGIGGAVATALRRRTVGHKLSELLQTGASALSAYLVLRALFLAPARSALLDDRTSPALVDGLPRAVADELRRLSAGLDPVNQVSLYEMRTYLANMLLRDGDFMSMAHGLEVRVPFLDHKLVEFVARIPGRLKLDPVLPKPLLIRAMGDLLPPAIYQRRKTGFTFPWEYWLRNELRSLVDEMLVDTAIGARLGLNGEVCLRLWRQFLGRAPGVTWSRVWSLFVLYRWCDEHRVLAA
jgi:asparagine synthase (glutamine-hydrolysing)